MAIALFGFAVIAYFAMGMPGMDHGVVDHSSMAGMDMRRNADEFARRIGAADAFVVKVEPTPSPAIDGTDATLTSESLTSSVLPGG